MAAPTQITKLPEVLRSPSTIQYFAYRHKVKHSNPYFKPRFTFKLEDRQHTLLAENKWRHTDPLMPPYPYGENMHFPEANFGLYGGATVQSGSKISKGRNKGKTLRHWFPNVRVETVRSEALGRELKLPITARVMRTITKCGGIDAYVTGIKPARIKELGLLGWKLRWLVMTSPKYRIKHELQLQKYNLPKHYSLEGTFEDAWNDETVRAKMIEQQEAAWQDLRQAAKRFEKHVQRCWVDSGEKESYEIPRLESLNRGSPYSLNLPEQLEKPDIAEGRYRRIRTFHEHLTPAARAQLAAEERRLETEGSVEQPGVSDALSPRVEDRIEGLTMNMKAQDLGVNLSDNNSQNIEMRLEAVKQMIRDQVPKIEDEVSTARAEKERDDKAEVLLAKTAEDHIATIDQQAIERNVEQHLDTAREEMKKDEELEARRAGTSRKSEDMPQPSKR
jgi:ribosomal protein L28